MFGFPVPVSNKEIPRGWFAALVRFINSLLLRGDGRYFAVTHTTEGTTIKPTPALIQALERSGGAAPSAGGGTTYGIEATIDGSTASIALVPGSTVTSLSLVPTAPVTLTPGADGELIIGATVSSGGFGPPNYNDLNGVAPVPATGGTYYTAPFDGWIVGSVEQTGPGGSTPSVLLNGSIYVSIGGTFPDMSPEVNYPLLFPLKKDMDIAFIDAGDCDWSNTFFVHTL